LTHGTRAPPRAVDLWQTLGFEIVGTVPKAFRQRERGLVDVYGDASLLDDIELNDRLA